jgi:formylglycine-generating enzyme required for sulfatase activity
VVTGPARRPPSSRAACAACAASAAVAVGLAFAVPDAAAAKAPRCPAGMAPILGRFCVDPFEASLERKSGRAWVAHSPYDQVAANPVRAVSRRGVFPQAYISRNEADAACKASRKRLCSEDEWVVACRGRTPTRYPYGDDHKPSYCNDAGASPLNHYYGTASGPPTSAYGWGPMNDPRLNRLPGTLARTGAFRKCTNTFRVWDMVGNLHEWVDDPAGTFRGGYYLDTKINGEGCAYHTVAHNADYHDYSTGFRCCADAR